MFKNFSPGLFFSMAGVTIVIIAPFIMLFQPIFQNVFFVKPYDQDIFLLNPLNLRLVIFSCLIFGVMCFLLAYKRTIAFCMTGLLLFIVGGALTYYSTQNYLKINSEQIERNFFWTSDRYKWTELQEVYYEYVVGARDGEVKIITKTGETFIIKEAELNSQAKSYIYQYSVKNDIPFVEREKVDS